MYMTTKGFSLTDLDTSVAPGDDFFRYAVGGWLKHNPIPADYSRWGTFELLVEDSYKALQEILEHPELFSGSPLGELAKKAHTFYTVAMQEDVIEAAGHEPLAHERERISLLTSYEDVVREVAHMHVFTASPLFGFYATPDSKNSAFTIVGLGQGGLGLPDRDYYLSDEDRHKQTRERYQVHMTRMFELLGYDKQRVREGVATVFAIEKSLAEVSTPREDLRDPEKNYHKMSLDKVRELSPFFDWQLYFKSMGLPNPGDIDVGQVKFFEELSAILERTPVESWKWYLEWNLLRNCAGTLSSAFVNERFDFYGKFLSGQQELKPRFKRIIDATNAALGKAVGRLYVEQHFSPLAKERALHLVESLIKVTGRRIERLGWMGEETKKEALKKLAAIKVKIGYPDQWLDYSSLDIKDDSYTANVIRANYFEFQRQLGKINKPTDMHEWLMDPQDINAYYDQLRNEIVFPAGILQPPFFSDSADDALNFGGIGGVIGHEITHGFDDQGRKYDAQGNIHEWWTQEDADRFSAQAKTVEQQYNAFTIVDGLHVNGEFTLGENIADLGGVSIAFEALQDQLKEKPGEIIDGFTPEQRFFLSWAQSWKQNVRPELAKLYIVVDPHSPPQFRVNGPLVNVEAFYKAFGIGPDGALYLPPERRAAIW